MNVAIDLDGTIDAYPSMFLALMAALKHSANHVTVLTGIDDGKVTPLAHGDLAWTDTLRPVSEDAPDCPRCVRKLPQLERLDALLRDAGR